jgi:ADP-ribose pyrophosphatase
MRERTLKSRTVFKGVLLHVDVEDVELEDGRRAEREILRHPPAVVVLARRPDGRFALVKQFRKPVEADLIEVVAGCLERGETPAAAARREVAEETGYKVRRLRRLGRVYSTPGCCDEVLHLFYAELSPAPAGHCPDDDEQVEVLFLDRDRVERMIARGEIADAKTLAVWFRARQADLIR